MNEWRRSTWGEEVLLKYGKSLRDYSDAAGHLRVFGTNGPIGWTDKPLADGPGVILGRKGAYRGVHYSPAPFFVIDTAYYVVPKTDLDMRWLYYAVIHHQWVVPDRRRAHRSRQPRVRRCIHARWSYCPILTNNALSPVSSARWTTRSSRTGGRRRRWSGWRMRSSGRGSWTSSR